LNLLLFQLLFLLPAFSIPNLTVVISLLSPCYLLVHRPSKGKRLTFADEHGSEIAEVGSLIHIHNIHNDICVCVDLRPILFIRLYPQRHLHLLSLPTGMHRKSHIASDLFFSPHCHTITLSHPPLTLTLPHYHRTFT
jgi:hypothetical protein